MNVCLAAAQRPLAPEPRAQTFFISLTSLPSAVIANSHSTLATLGSNAFNATQFMAQLVNEHKFGSMYQQGETYSTLILNIDEDLLLVLVFGTQQTVGSMKYYAAPAVKQIAEQLRTAAARGEMSLDLCDMNPDDVQTLFRRTTTPANP